MDDGGDSPVREPPMHTFPENRFAVDKARVEGMAHAFYILNHSTGEPEFDSALVEKMEKLIIEGLDLVETTLAELQTFPPSVTDAPRILSSARYLLACGVQESELSSSTRSTQLGISSLHHMRLHELTTLEKILAGVDLVLAKCPLDCPSLGVFRERLSHLRSECRELRRKLERLEPSGLGRIPLVMKFSPWYYARRLSFASAGIVSLAAGVLCASAAGAAGLSAPWPLVGLVVGFLLASFLASYAYKESE